MKIPNRRGSKVIVRTFGGYPRIRKLWIIGPIAAVVAEEAAFARLVGGIALDQAGAVAVPAEDVFEYDAAAASIIDPKQPFRGWSDLRPISQSFSQGA